MLIVEEVDNSIWAIGEINAAVLVEKGTEKTAAAEAYEKEKLPEEVTRRNSYLLENEKMKKRSLRKEKMANIAASPLLFLDRKEKARFFLAVLFDGMRKGGGEGKVEIKTWKWVTQEMSSFKGWLRYSLFVHCARWYVRGWNCYFCGNAYRLQGNALIFFAEMRKRGRGDGMGGSNESVMLWKG